MKDPDQAHPDIPAHRRRILQEHGLFINKSGAFPPPHPIEQATDKVLKEDRNDGMRTASAAKFLTTQEEYAVAPEHTIFSEIWPLIFKTERQVKDGEDWVMQDWKDDGLYYNPDVLFLIETVTALDLKNEKNKPYADLIPRVKDPKPDLCFGLAQKAFSDDEMKWIAPVEFCASVQTMLYFGFFIVEFKGPGGGIAEAEDQAARSASTLVEASREFYHAAGQRDLGKIGPDTDNIIFSLCMTPGHARMFVHWAWVKSPDNIEYHMTRVESYNTLKGTEVKNLRLDIYRIMDWGLLGRKWKIKTMLPMIEHRANDIAKDREERRKKKQKKTGRSSKSGGSSKGGTTQQSSSNA
ncbi:MAG: hypothetical protein Q9201_001320 [Fulgogasparrea decipioides]